MNVYGCAIYVDTLLYCVLGGAVCCVLYVIVYECCALCCMYVYGIVLHGVVVYVLGVSCIVV